MHGVAGLFRAHGASNGVPKGESRACSPEKPLKNMSKESNYIATRRGHSLGVELGCPEVYSEAHAR